MDRQNRRQIPVLRYASPAPRRPARLVLSILLFALFGPIAIGLTIVMGGFHGPEPWKVGTVAGPLTAIYLKGDFETSLQMTEAASVVLYGGYGAIILLYRRWWVVLVVVGQHLAGAIISAWLCGAL